MVAVGRVRASNEKRYAVRGCVGLACRTVIVKEREFVLNFNFECVCTGGT
jgi:hypothetical protein